MKNTTKTNLIGEGWGVVGGWFGVVWEWLGVVRGGMGGRELAPLSYKVVFHADHDFDIH